MTGPVTFEHYGWVREELEYWTGSGYCLTLVESITADRLLDRLDAYPSAGNVIGVSAFTSLVCNDELRWPGPGQAVAIGDTGQGWTLMAECMSSYAGTVPAIAARVTADHDWVVHSENVNGLSQFVWWSGGVLQTRFEPLIPTMVEVERAWAGADPDALLPLMRDVGGFNIDGREGPGPDGHFTHIEAVFALTERLTGVHVTKELLDTIELTVAVIPEPADDRYGRELKDAGWDVRRTSAANS